MGVGRKKYNKADLRHFAEVFRLTEPLVELIVRLDMYSLDVLKDTEEYLVNERIPEDDIADILTDAVLRCIEYRQTQEVLDETRT